MPAIPLQNFDHIPDVSKIDKLDDLWKSDATGNLRGYAEFLTSSLTVNNENFVLNVNGGWGTGKTFFIRHWVRHLQLSAVPVVYFDAWENDCAEDPLMPLAAEIVAQLNACIPVQERMSEEVKKIASDVSMATVKLIACGIAKQTIGESGMHVAEEALKRRSFNLGKWRDARVSAKQEFKEECAKFVSKLPNGQALVFIDELDRCKPTFSIALLERVKHIFSIHGLKFVVVTNNEQLVKSIRAIYGIDFDADGYLRKFFMQHIELPYIQLNRSIGQHLFGESSLYARHQDRIGPFFACLPFRDFMQCYSRYTAALAMGAFRHEPLAFLIVFRHRNRAGYIKLAAGDKSTWQNDIKEAKIILEDRIMESMNDFISRRLDAPRNMVEWDGRLMSNKSIWQSYVSAVEIVTYRPTDDD